VSKVTFRADEDLIREVEALDASKSEVMREALRAYLEDGAGSGPGDGESDPDSDARIAERVDAVLADRLRSGAGARDLNVTISVEPPAGTGTETRVEPEAAGREQQTEATSADPDRETDAQSRQRSEPGRERTRTCSQCGAALSNDHVYCPNCGEKAANRLFCECGDEIRSDWAYCPSCGRRTPSADVLDG